MEGRKGTHLEDPLFLENVFRIRRPKGYLSFQVIDVYNKTSYVNLPSSLTPWQKIPLLPGLPHGLPYAWSTPRTTLWITPLLLGEKLFEHPRTPTNKNLLAFTITIGRHLGSNNLWAYSSLVMLSKLLKKSNNWVYLDART